MPASALVLFPATSDVSFNLPYYANTHMPLVSKQWGKYGLRDWKVVELADSPDGSRPYIVAALLTWDSLDGLRQALASEEAKAVFEDASNFCNKTPLFLPGDIVGSS
ncbi:hypothetical protein CLAIMM_03339 [Cladophialophora immunda]|nr:hypothetical protein CLAIMM_03339 [Cladophialophora immunda]